QHGGGVVVDHGRGFRGGEIGQQFFQSLFTLAALAGGEIVFQVDRVIGYREHGLDRCGREQGAAKICVQNRAGGVDDAPVTGLAVDVNRTFYTVEDRRFA